MADPTTEAILWLFFAPLLLLLAVFLYVSLYDSIKVIEKGTVMIVERLGQYSYSKQGGITYLIPFIERPRFIVWRTSETIVNAGNSRFGRGRAHTRAFSVIVRQEKVDRIDIREQIMDFPLQEIITRDNVQIEIHPMLLFKLKDPIRVAYQTYDLAHAVEKLVQTTLRSIIGDMGLDDTLASREEINKGMFQRISNVCFDWGLEIIKVEILEILPGDEIQAAMHKQIAAERIRRAMIIEADGFREMVKTEAEGDAQAMISLAKAAQQESILQARGLGDSKLIIARAEAEALKTVSAALKEFKIDPTQYMIGLKYIDAFQKIGEHAGSRTLYMPYESEVYGAVNELA